MCSCPYCKEVFSKSGTARDPSKSLKVQTGEKKREENFSRPISSKQMPTKAGVFFMKFYFISPQKFETPFPPPPPIPPSHNRNMNIASPSSKAHHLHPRLSQSSSCSDDSEDEGDALKTRFFGSSWDPHPPSSARTPTETYCFTLHHLPPPDVLNHHPALTTLKTKETL